MAAGLAEIAARAEQAMREGRFDEALDDLDYLVEAVPQDATVRLMRAYLHRARGEIDAADTEFRAAIARNGTDAGLRATYARFLLDNANRPEDAADAFAMALEIAPDMVDAQIDRALALARTRYRPEGLAELREVVRRHPRHRRALFNLALLLRAELAHAEAIELVETILQDNPNDDRALTLLGLCRFERGERASHIFRKAGTLAQDKLPSIASEAGALVSEDGLDAALALLDRTLSDHPLWRAGQQMRAELRWQAGAGDRFGDGYTTAFEHHPNTEALWLDYIALTARALGDDAGIEALKQAEAALGESRPLRFTEANLERECGNHARAEELYAEIGIEGDDRAGIEYLRFLVMAHRFDEAEALGRRLVARGLGGEAWPYIAVAWRMLGDERAMWLERGGDFVRPYDTGMTDSELGQLAETLRRLHRFAERPIQQTLRGGTQTDSNLFAHADPAIRILRSRIEEAVRSYLADLPPADPEHPLLSPRRDYFRFEGSWSVRLSDAGFHVSHIHSKGTISSAFYVELPPILGRGGTDLDGWLTVGEPPAELGCDLPPQKIIEPKRGRLALFPSYSWHGTRPFSKGERMTCAFDIRLY